MGLQKEIVLPNGITLNYWRINAVTVDVETNKTSLRIGGYQAKADALEGKKAVHSFHAEYVGSNNPIGLTTDPREYQNLLYDKLRSEPAAFAPRTPLVGATVVSDAPD